MLCRLEIINASYKRGTTTLQSYHTLQVQQRPDKTTYKIIVFLAHKEIKYAHIMLAINRPTHTAQQHGFPPPPAPTRLSVLHPHGSTWNKIPKTPSGVFFSRHQPRRLRAPRHMKLPLLTKRWRDSIFCSFARLVSDERALRSNPFQIQQKTQKSNDRSQSSAPRTKPAASTCRHMV